MTDYQSVTSFQSLYETSLEGGGAGPKGKIGQKSPKKRMMGNCNDWMVELEKRNPEKSPSSIGYRVDVCFDYGRSTMDCQDKLHMHHS